jgi:hypothetical protein
LFLEGQDQNFGSDGRNGPTGAGQKRDTYIDKTLDEINDSVSKEFNSYNAKYKSFIATDPKAEDKFTLAELRLLFTGKIRTNGIGLPF